MVKEHNKWELAGLIDLDQALKINYCPYCGSYLMDTYLGDFHGYTNCSDCDDSLDIDIVDVKRGTLIFNRKFDDPFVFKRASH